MKLFIFYSNELSVGQVVEYVFWFVDPDTKTFKNIGKSKDREIVKRLAIEWDMTLVDLPNVNEVSIAIVLENLGYVKK